MIFQYLFSGQLSFTSLSSLKTFKRWSLFCNLKRSVCDGETSETWPAWQALKGEREGGNWVRESAWGAWSRALMPFPLPFERLPRRLSETLRATQMQNFVNFIQVCLVNWLVVMRTKKWGSSTVSFDSFYFKMQNWIFVKNPLTPDSLTKLSACEY